MIPARAALERLREGNLRFASGAGRRDALTSPTRRDELAEGQAPFAIIHGCSDSRVPAEIVFDQGLGDLFVIRVAGNIVAPSQVGSIEFAAAQFGVRLVVVLGHSQCGAVLATLAEIAHPTHEPVNSPRAIVDSIRPFLEPLVAADTGQDPASLVDRAVRANIRATANHLRNESGLLGELMREREVLVVGAEYSLDTGLVDFFDGMPDGD